MRSIRVIVAGLFVFCLSVVVVITATQNSVPKYSTGGTLVDSHIYDDGTFVGINASSPGRTLTVDSGSSTLNAVLGLYTGGTERVFLAGLTDSSLSIQLGGSEYARFNQTGFGIGTSTPASKLHVVGDVTVTGNIAAKYQDVAEWVRVREHVPPGTVVVINDGETNLVESSKRRYDTAVAGVVSGQPGISLGEKGADKVLVAQSGRVRVKVDASYGAVRAGDLLVTSSTPGYAMRSAPLRSDLEP